MTSALSECHCRHGLPEASVPGCLLSQTPGLPTLLFLSPSPTATKGLSLSSTVVDRGPQDIAPLAPCMVCGQPRASVCPAQWLLPEPCTLHSLLHSGLCSHVTSSESPLTDDVTVRACKHCTWTVAEEQRHKAILMW